jgi:hypothetical protein
MNSRYWALITVFVTVFATANDELKNFIAKLDDIEKAKWQVNAIICCT